MKKLAAIVLILFGSAVAHAQVYPDSWLWVQPTAMHCDGTPQSVSFDLPASAPDPVWIYEAFIANQSGTPGNQGLHFFGIDKGNVFTNETNPPFPASENCTNGPYTCNRKLFRLALMDVSRGYAPPPEVIKYPIPVYHGEKLIFAPNCADGSYQQIMLGIKWVNDPSLVPPQPDPTQYGAPVTVWEKSLPGNSTGNGTATWRTKFTPNATGTQYRFWFKAAASGTLFVPLVTVGRHAGNGATVGTPQTIKFNGGSGFTIQNGAIVSSDWMSGLDLAANQEALVMFNSLGYGDAAYASPAEGGEGVYFTPGVLSADQQTPPAGTSFYGNTGGLFKIDARSPL